MGGYSYADPYDPERVTGYGEARFESATYFDGYLWDGESPGFWYISGRPVLGPTLPPRAQIVWGSRVRSGGTYSAIATVIEQDGGWRVVQFTAPSGVLEWKVQAMEVRN